MPPTLRSFAPSTPQRTSTPAPTDSEPVALTPRKSPHCKTCGRPRKGHPLRACEAESPPVDSPLKSATQSPRPKNLIDALEAMNLEERDRKEKRERRKSAQRPNPPFPSLPSISTVTGEILESLLVPGLLDDDGSDHGADDSVKQEAVIRWRETSVVTPGTGTSQPAIVESSADGPPLPEEEVTPTKKRLRGGVGKQAV
ncbi:hypothetical protein MSAN_02341800 [Mycena sanguinolenta]|uniref:Uncharacterized protein n=1 Tax=Mycena sanguinolenta TaxID=230812 RepID=A0A8H6X691_9AGAR|nr:hypothetical protein MSAN_02341800 [Mycena sanguinolenta]